MEELHALWVSQAASATPGGDGEPLSDVSVSGRSRSWVWGSERQRGPGRLWSPRDGLLGVKAGHLGDDIRARQGVRGLWSPVALAMSCAAYSLSSGLGDNTTLA